MVFGFGVEEEERISNQLEELLKNEYQVNNIAVPGWGLDQMMLAFRKYAPVFKPKIAIIAFINDNLQRSLEAFRTGGEYQNKPSFRIKNGSLELRRIDDNGWANKYFKKYILSIYSINYFYRNFYRHYLIGSLNKKIFEEILKIARANNTELIFVKIPKKMVVLPKERLAL